MYGFGGHRPNFSCINLWDVLSHSSYQNMELDGRSMVIKMIEEGDRVNVEIQDE